MKLSKKHQQMHALVEQWQQSGQTKVEFAKENQITYSKLRYWIRKMGENHSEGFLELTSPSFNGLIIRYPNGVELQLPSQIPVVHLRDMIFI